MTELAEILASFVPDMVVRRFVANPTPPTAPQLERFPAAALFADISGFTPLAERLAGRGPTGAEDLTRILNAYFGQLIDLVGALGGDVIKFAGDGALALWPATDEDLATATRRAAQCGLALQLILHDYQATQEERLSMRIGIGAGEVVAVHAGGVFGRWEFLVAGEALVQMSLANHQAPPGQVALSPEAWELVQAYCEGAPLPPSPHARGQGACMRLDTILDPLPPRLPTPCTLTPQVEAALRAYLPGAIQARVAAGQSGWLAEMRRVTVLFANLPAIPSALELAQMIMSALQTILYRHEGSVRQFIVDDKGATLIAALGLPPLAHEDDAVRGVQVAMEMSAELRRLGLRGAIGVTTGQAFCGLVGNERRREYALVGDIVNLAARLMEAASRRTEKDRLLVLCDEATCQAAQARIEFEPLPPLTVKGKAEPLAVYRPLRKKQAAVRSRTALVGRSKEYALLADALQALLLKHTGRVIILEGEAGIGKSRLVEEFSRQAETFRVATFRGAGNAIEPSTPYHAWHSVFEQMLDIELAACPVRQQRVLEWLDKLDPALAPLAPLLNPILLINLAENEQTAQLSGRVRADRIHDLLLRLLQDGASRSPTLVILEDAQWMDAASWELAALFAQQVHPLLMVIVTRPLDAGRPAPGEAPAEYEPLLETPDSLHIRLGQLNAEETLALVCQRLGVAELSEPLANLMMSKVEGQPFFAEELAYALRDNGLLQIIGDKCYLAPGAGDWRAIELPPTVHGAITSRIDRLAPAEQLTLKVASVIGRVFDIPTLRAIYPIEDDKARLAERLDRLEQLDLAARLSPDSDDDYMFKQAITCDVAYQLMPFSQRQQLHRAAARYYEQMRPDQFHYGRLVHHWAQAGDVPKALDYLEKAGEEALRNGAHQEAAHLFSQALDLERETRGQTDTWAIRPPDAAAAEESAGRGVSRLRRARWERLLSEAYWEAGNVTASFMHAQRTLEHLGQQAVTPTGLVSSLARQLLRQGAHRLWPARFLGRQQADAETLELGRAYYRLGMVRYMNNQSWQALDATLHSLNLIESAAPQSPELASDYINACLAFGVLSLHPLAGVYKRLAQNATAAAKSLPASAYVLEMTGLYSMGLGQWGPAKEALEEAIWLSDQLGNWHAWGESLNMLALLHHYHGEFAPLAEMGQKAHALGVQRANLQLQTWGLNLRAMHAAQAGQLEQAIADLEKAWELLTGHNLDRITAILNRAVLAMAYLRQGKLRSAREVVYNVAQFLGQSMPVWVVAFDGYASIAQVYLAAWEAESAPSARPTEAEELARKACAALHRYARVFAIGRPRAWLCQGWYDWLAGHPAKARRALQKSLAAARRLDMPYEQGLAEYEIGRQADEYERETHLVRACEIFTRLQAAYDLARAQAAANAAQRG